MTTSTARVDANSVGAGCGEQLYVKPCLEMPCSKQLGAGLRESFILRENSALDFP